MDVFCALSCTHDARMSSVDYQVRVPIPRDIPVQVSSVQEVCKLASSVLSIGSEILIKIIQGVELGVIRRPPMCIGRLVHNPGQTVLF